jgi:hypothetical protein
MKKICLLSFATFFSVIVFAQNGKAVTTSPGQPKPGRGPVAVTGKVPAGAHSLRNATNTPVEKPATTQQKQRPVSPAVMSKTEAPKS